MLSSRYLHLHEALGLGPMWLNQNAKITHAAPQTAASAAPVRPKTIAADTAQAVRTLSAGAHQARTAAIATAQTAKPAVRVPEAAPKAIAETPAKTEKAAHSDNLPRLDVTIRPSEIMVVSICPSTEDSLHGTLFSGDVGTLLDNILAAIGLKPEQAHKTAWIKTAPVFTALPDAEHIRSELAEMQNELTASQARAVLFLGKIFDSPDMIGLMNELCAERPHFVIPHPARLLMQPQLKAQAWQTLKPLKQLLAKAV